MPEASDVRYDPDLAYELMKLSTLAYFDLGEACKEDYVALRPLIHRSGQELEQIIDDSGIATKAGARSIAAKLREQSWDGWQVKSIEQGQSRALLFKRPSTPDGEPGRVVVAFRGTQPTHFDQWIRDMRFSPYEVKTPEGSYWMHSGFHKDWELIATKFAAELEKLNVTSFDATGHSLGGVLAVRSGADRVYTYGQPQGGDQNFCDMIPPEHYIRVVRRGDPIVLLPPNPDIPRIPGIAGILGVDHPYRHGGVEELYITDVPELKNLGLRSLIKFLRHPVRHIGTHSPGNYLQSIHDDPRRHGIEETRQIEMPPSTPTPHLDRGRKPEPPPR